MMEKTEQGLGRLCVIGDPVEHSKSPLIQNAMIAKLGIPYHYTKRLVHQGDTQEWLDTARREGFAGFNATMPHKQALYELVDRRDGSAERTGSVNTVCLRNGQLWGFSTDGDGFVAALEQQGHAVADRSVTLLGAGGAARSVAPALLRAKASRVTVCARDAAKASALCHAAGGGMSHVGFDPATLSQTAESTQVLINCTNLGMTGLGQFSDLTFVDFLPADAVVCDLIYDPAETELLRRARERGLVAMNGLPMLVWQGVLALEQFLGGAPLDRKAMADAAFAALER